MTGTSIARRGAHGKDSGVCHVVPPVVSLSWFCSRRLRRRQGGYFGRNKVQYRDFKFQVLKTEHFDIHFYPEEEAAARMAARHGRALVRAALEAPEP